jgi:hypothetical protein
MHWQASCQLVVEVELHRAGDVIHAQVFPFGLADRNLAALKSKITARMLPVPASNANR